MHVNNHAIALVPAHRGRDHDQGIFIDEVPYASLVPCRVAWLCKEVEFQRMCKGEQTKECQKDKLQIPGHHDGGGPGMAQGEEGVGVGGGQIGEADRGRSAVVVCTRVNIWPNFVFRRPKPWQNAGTASLGRGHVKAVRAGAERNKLAPPFPSTEENRGAGADTGSRPSSKVLVLLLIHVYLVHNNSRMQKCVGARSR